MLRTIAVFSMQGSIYAASVVALLSLIPFINYIASGIIALYTLRMGPKEGVKVVAFSTLLLTVVMAVLSGKTTISAVFLVSSWLPVLVASMILGYTRSLSASLLSAGGMGLLFVMGMYLFVPDPSLWWQQLIAPFWDMMSAHSDEVSDPEKTQEMVVAISQVMTGLMAASLTINIIVGLLIGRSLQAKLYNPGGFANEFHQLSLGKAAATLTMGLMVITILPFSAELPLLRECLPVVLVVFALQGLAVVHAIVKNQQKTAFWLVAIYVMLVLIMPQMIVILAMIGILEQWFNFRHRSMNDASD